ncbi:hypothetical protein D3C73_1336920 [compost metagenome]
MIFCRLPDSMTQDTLISEVLTILMLTPSPEITWNICAATPGWLTMPAPTIDTLTRLSSEVTSR